MKKVKRLLIVSSDKHLRDILHFCFDGWGYEVFVHEPKIEDINTIKRIFPDAIVIDVHSATKSHLEICRLLKEDFITALVPIITLINKGQLREQLLTLKQGVDDYLIKPPDPLDLRTRIEIAIKRSQYSFYSSPLTGLPGARIIEDAIKERIEKDVPFAFAHIDIDNFKYFNDVFFKSIAQSDIVDKRTLRNCSVYFYRNHRIPAKTTMTGKLKHIVYMRHMPRAYLSQ